LLLSLLLLLLLMLLLVILSLVRAIVLCLVVLRGHAAVWENCLSTTIGLIILIGSRGTIMISRLLVSRAAIRIYSNSAVGEPTDIILCCVQLLLLVLQLIAGLLEGLKLGLLLLQCHLLLLVDDALLDDGVDLLDGRARVVRQEDLLLARDPLLLLQPQLLHLLLLVQSLAYLLVGAGRGLLLGRPGRVTCWRVRLHSSSSCWNATAASCR